MCLFFCQDLEDITAENAKLEHEISLLRMKQEKGEPTQNGVSDPLN